MTEIKLHQPIIDTIIVCLKSIFEEEKVADKEVATHLKQNKSFGSRDRSMIAETVYDIVRWKLKYTHQLSLYNEHYTLYKHLILISVLNRNYAIKNPAILEVDENDINALLGIIKQPITQEYIAQSYPKEFYNFSGENIGEKWHDLAIALNQKPSVFIRLNTLKKSVNTNDFIELLKKENIDARDCFASLAMTNSAKEMPNNILANTAKYCIQILSKNNLKNSDLYKHGLFEFQDIGSQAIGNFLFDSISNKSKINELQILDLCAGAGGKTLHLSALLNNKGKIYATDYKASRLKNLQLRATQAGCENIEIIDYSSAKELKNIDIILIDAPCSGTGTFKRQADLKYKITREKVAEYVAIQASLLDVYKKVLRKNGKIIYATCSVLPQENQIQIQDFVDKNDTFKLIKDSQLLPTEYNGDGFYMAELSH